MHNYISKYTIMGMMSAKYEVLGDWQGLKKNRNKAVSFDKSFDPCFPKTSYAYIYDKPSCKYSKSTQVVSVFDKSFFGLSGNKYREIRETRNYFNKLVTIKDFNQNDVLGLIDRWDEQSGGKYHWQKHSGYDKAFFNKWYLQEKDNLISYFYYIGDKIVGYAILHKDNDCYNYIIRKTDISIRNTCLYVDYKTFEQIYAIENQSFLVNWGASSGNVLKYKRKFPIHSQSAVYFYSK